MKARSKRTMHNITLALITTGVLVLGFAGLYALLAFTPLGTEQSSVQEQRRAALEAEGIDASNSTAGGATASDEPVGLQSELSDEELEARTAQIVDSMSTEEKVAQLFFVTPETLMQVTSTTEAGSYTEAYYDIYPVGGMLYAKRNLVSDSQLSEMLTDMQTYAAGGAKAPLLLGIVEEGGEVAPVADSSGFDAQTVSKAPEVTSADDARKNAETIGGYLSELGFNVNIAPMADISTSKGSFQERTFGTNADDVGTRVSAQVSGYISSGIMPCVKYFPGEGGVSGDPESESTTSDATVSQLREKDMVPFQKAMGAGVPMVMVGTTTYTQISDDTPACLSERMVTGELRTELGYDGVVLTAPLNTSAIYNDYSASGAAVEAIQAGCDMIVEPMSFLQAYQGVLSAVKSGQISEERLDESVTRIVRMKLHMPGISKWLATSDQIQNADSAGSGTTSSGSSASGASSRTTNQ